MIVSHCNKKPVDAECTEEKPFNPLHNLKPEVLKWIFETGTEVQKDLVSRELNSRVNRLECEVNWRQTQLERVKQVRDHVLNGVPF